MEKTAGFEFGLHEKFTVSPLMLTDSRTNNKDTAVQC